MNESSDIKEIWLYMLNNIYCDGQDVNKDGTEVRELLGISIFIDSETLTLFNTLYSPKLFIELIQKGAFDIEEYPIKGEALADYVMSINDKDVIDLNRDFVYSYPERLKSIITPCSESDIDIGYVNQLDVMKNRLIKCSGSNRAIASLYIPGIDGDREDIPCLNHLQAFIRDEKLYLYCLFRSNDIFGAFPSNILFLQHLGLQLLYDLRETYPELNFGGIQYRINSAHYYKTDADIVKKILTKNDFL